MTIKRVREVLCEVFFQDGHSFWGDEVSFRGYVISPKTGRTLHLSEKHLVHFPSIVSIIRNSVPVRGGMGKALLTIKDLRDLFFCPELPEPVAARCYAGCEETDGECSCSKCEERINSCRYHPGMTQVMNGDMG